MSRVTNTLARFIMEEERRHPEATGDFSTLLSQISLAAKVIQREVSKAGLVDILGYTGHTNVQGEEVKKLDVFANDTIVLAENLDGAPNAGVDINFSEGVVWDSGIAIKEAEESTRVTASAFSQGEVTSTNTIRRNDDGSLGLSASFTGAAEGRTYSVLVYNNGVFQGGAGGIGDDVQYLYIDPRWDEDFIMWLIGHWSFALRMENGGCEWGLDLNETRTLRLADGTKLVGNEIRLQEEVKGNGHYAYTGFDGIDIVGNAQSMTFHRASVLP